MRKFVWLRSLGRLHFWGWPKKQQKTLPRDNLSDLSQLKKSLDFLEAKSLHSEPNHVASTWTRRERKTKGNTAGTYQPPVKKRVTRIEVDLPTVSAKRFQADPRNEKSPSAVAGAVVQPRQ